MKARTVLVRAGLVGAVLAASTVVLGAPPAHAAGRAWDGGGTADTWSTPENWGGDTLPGNGDVLTFPGGALRPIQQNDLALTELALSFTGDGYEIGGDPLDLATGAALGVDVPAPANGTATVTAPLYLHGLTTVQRGDGDVIVLAGGVGGDPGASLALAGAGTAVIGGTVTVPVSAAAGILRLDGTIDGPLALAGGELRGAGTSGATSLSAGARLEAGAGPGAAGTLTFTTLALGTGTTWSVDINGVAPGAHDLVVATSLAIGQATTLDVDTNGPIPPGVELVIASLTDATVGTFQGLPEGAVVEDSTGGSWQISYDVAGTKDVTLTKLAPVTRVWDGGAGTTAWSDAANWAPDGVPAPADTLVFPEGPAQTATSNDIPGLAGMTLRFEGGAYVLTGAPIVGLGPAGLQVDIAGPGTVRIAAPLAVASATAIDVGDGDVLALEGTVGGSGSLAVAGPGTVRVEGAVAVDVAASSGVLGGTGSIAGIAALSGAARLDLGSAPGAAGAMTIGTLDLDPGVVWTVDLLGVVGDDGSDRLLAAAFLAGGAELRLDGGPDFDPAIGTTVEIADLSSSTSGTFADLPEGALVTDDNGVRWRLSYLGGDGNDITVTRQGDVVERIAGSDRVATAVQISKNAHPVAQSVDAVVLTRADLFPDNVTGTPLAAHLRAPVLLTDPSSLSPATLDEIVRVLKPTGTVVILGGTSAVSSAVESAVRSGRNYAITRLGGTDRYATALLVAEYLTQARGVGTIFLATGLAFPDGLTAGVAAARHQGVVLLTNGPTLGAEAATYIAARPGVPRYAIGGPAGAADPGSIKVSGADRYETAGHVAERFFDEATSAGLATGLDFPDALAGGADMATRFDGPILLADPAAAEFDVRTATYLSDRRTAIDRGVVYGGTAALPLRIFSLFQTAIS